MSSLKELGIKGDLTTYDSFVWKTISGILNLSENFIIKYRDYLNWNIIFSKQTLSPDLLNDLLSYKPEIFDERSWCAILVNNKLSECFIRKLIKRKIFKIFKLPWLFWHVISYNQKLSLEFIDDYKNILDWIPISSRQELTIDFILTHLDYIQWDWLAARTDINKILNNKDLPLLIGLDPDFDKTISQHFLKKE